MVFVLWNDQVKIWFLMACLFGCLSTLLTSSSHLMGRAELKVLKQDSVKHCRHPRQQAQKCLQGYDKGNPHVVPSVQYKEDLPRLHEKESSMEESSHDDSSLSCTLLMSQVTKCEKAVAKAYDHINMSGCPKELQAVTVCEVEWCSSSVFVQKKDAREACQKECHTVRENLDRCVKRHVKQSFARYNLNEHGALLKKRI